jgi:hypothetical protein
MIESVRKYSQDTMDEVAIVTFLLSCKLSFKYQISFLHDDQEHLANIEFFQCKFIR